MKVKGRLLTSCPKKPIMLSGIREEVMLDIQW